MTSTCRSAQLSSADWRAAPIASITLERDEVNGLELLQRQQHADGMKGAYVFINERGRPFGRVQHFQEHASITNTVRYTAMSPEPFKDR